MNEANIIQLSLVYFDSSNMIQQTILNQGSWRSLPTQGEGTLPSINLHAKPVPKSVPALPGSKLSVSTYIFPASPGKNDYLRTIINGSFLSPYDILSSVATCQDSNNSPVMVDLVGTTVRKYPPKNIFNLFSQFRYMNMGRSSLNETDIFGVTTLLNTSLPGGLACVYNYGGGKGLHGRMGQQARLPGHVALRVETTPGPLVMCIDPEVRGLAYYDKTMLGQTSNTITGIYTYSSTNHRNTKAMTC